MRVTAVCGKIASVIAAATCCTDYFDNFT